MSEQKTETFTKEQIIDALIKIFPTESETEKKKIKEKIQSNFDTVHIEEYEKPKLIKVCEFLTNTFKTKELKEYKEIYNKDFVNDTYKQQITKLIAILDPIIAVDYLLGFVINRRYIPRIFTHQFEYFFIESEIFEIIGQYEEKGLDFPGIMVGYGIDILVESALQNECYARNIPYRYFEDTLDFYTKNIYWITSRTKDVKNPEELIIINDFLSFSAECEKIINNIYHEMKSFLAKCKTKAYQSQSIPLPEFLRAINNVRLLLIDVEQTKDLFVFPEEHEHNHKQVKETKKN